MDLASIGGYYNRFNKDKDYDAHLFRAGKVLQSAELNEVQSAASSRLKAIADVLFKDGDVIRDAQAIIDADTGAVTLQSGAIYLAGAVRGIQPASFGISTVGLVTLGVYLNQGVISEIDDPTLRDPATGTRNYEEPGAARLKVSLAWGVAGDGQAGDFYPVYTVEDGMLRAKEPPPQLDSVTQALARYDRDSAGGTYIVDGFHVSMAADLASGQQVYTVSEGRARVNGYGVEMPTSKRIVYPTAANVRAIDAEPHVSATPFSQRITCARQPVGEITQVRITAEKTASITHGSFTGAQDALPDASVLSLIQVKQGGITYTQGTDYKLTAGKVDWSPPGAEPSPGSAYDVTYQYIASVTPTDVDDTGFTVTGAVTGSLILASYEALLPRFDRLCLDAEGAFVWVGGIAADDNPIAPAIPNDLLLLATIRQTWTQSGTLARSIVRDTVRTVPMQDLYAVSAKLDHILGLVAQQRLEASANLIEAGYKKGLFVDPFLDDSLRDAGIPQSAQIADGLLSLRVDADAHAVGADIDRPAALASLPLPTLEQTLRTTEMKVNPYSAFDLPGAVVTLKPAIDQFVETRFGVTGKREELPFLRELTVAFALDRFGPGELLAGIEFDGIPVAPLGVQNVGGNVSGSFKIPAGVPVGSKTVRFTGSGGSWGEAHYVGSNSIVTLVFARPAAIDPLAETFMLSGRQQIVGVDLWFTQAGSSPVILQIRDTALGFPTRTVLAEARIGAGDMLTNGNPTRILFPSPVLLSGDTEYALTVLTVDANAALYVAELGKYDSKAGKWVTSQPYQVGTLLSSSNASTWTAHQDRDMAFRLLRASFSETSKTVDLGSVPVSGATDLMLLPLAEITDSATSVVYTLTLPDGAGNPGEILLAARQPVTLPLPVTGNIGIKARLTGNAAFSPVLWPGTQLVVGAVDDESLYISRAIPAGTNARVRVIFDALIPSGAAVAVAVAGIGVSAPWLAATFVTARPVDDGFVEHVYELASISSDMVRVKLALSGTSAARPRLANLRVIVT
ncbi:MAG: DUF4815 domain-containing protein [Desulfobulbus sp.]|nr:DUF4815 domain-containing protein [Desulfobulbus sp.]